VQDSQGLRLCILHGKPRALNIKPLCRIGKASALYTSRKAAGFKHKATMQDSQGLRLCILHRKPRVSNIKPLCRMVEDCGEMSNATSTHVSCLWGAGGSCLHTVREF